MTFEDLANAKAKLESANTNCMQIAADHEQTVADRTAELKAPARRVGIVLGTCRG